MSGSPAPSQVVAGLHHPLTSFIGREREIAEVRALLARARLVSLTGAGGSGKTRLAREVMEAAAADFPDGAAWVDLATLSNPELLFQRVAGSLGVRAQGGVAFREALLASLASRKLLLVLDNCEHLVDDVAGLVEESLIGSTGLRVLLTTREALGIPGEHAWHVPPLSVPEEGATSPTEVLDSEAGRLFVERARAARSDFQLTDQAVPAVVRICRRLDGIPLAVELAAARVRVLSPEQISDRLDDAFHLLTEGGRTAIPRHRTLRAAIDWSYDLLPEEERTFLLSLSVFRGPFSLSAAEAICARPGTDPYRVFDLVAHLVDRSLVEVQEARGAVVYRLLETVRQYAASRLEEVGGVLEGTGGVLEETGGVLEETGGVPGLRERHARFYLSLVQEAEPFLTGVHRREWVDRLGRDLDNLRQALAWSRTHDAQVHMDLAGALCWFWFSSRYWAEGRRWLEGALALSDASDRSARRARVLFASGVLACLQGRPAEAVPRLEESSALARELGDPRQEAYALNYLGMALIQDGNPAGDAPVQAAMTWFREAGERYGLRLALLLQASLAIARGQLDAASELAREGVDLARAFGQDRELGVALHVLGVVAFEEGKHERALELFRESLECFRRDPFDLFIARTMELVGSIACIEDDHARAVEVIGAADAIRAGLDANLFGIDKVRLDPHLASARKHLGDAEFQRLRAVGRELAPGRAMDLALGLGGEASAPAPSKPEPGELVVIGQTPPALEVLALGALEIRRDGAELGPDAWRLQKPRELLVHLLCHPRGRTREEIGDAFWPGASAAQTKNSFHVTLHHLRKVLGGTDRVIIDGDRYRVNPGLPVRFDVVRFERGLDAVLLPREGARPGAEPLEEVLALYRGEFLEEERAGDWHLEHRDRLRARYIDGLLALAEVLLEEERYGESAEVAARLVGADSLREDGHRILMTSRARMGSVEEALRHFEHLETFLREELESEPEAETRRLAERLRSGVSGG